MRLTVILLYFLLTITCSATQIEKEAMPKGNMVNNILNELVESAGPGIQYVVVNKDSTIFNSSLGLSNISNGASLSADHTMAAFSMTKTLTAIAVLQLVERNEINIDDKVSDYIEHPYDFDISIRHLLSHTSGIPNPIPLKWVHLTKNHNNFDEKAALSKVLSENSDSDEKPGAEYSYSNIGYW